MADFLRTTVTSVAQTLSGGESGLITRSGGIWTNTTNAISSHSGTNFLTNDGYIYGYGGFAAIDANGSGFEMLNGKDGIITAEESFNGVIDADLSSHLQITNHGVIHTSYSATISLNSIDDGASLSLTNTGFITANSSKAVSARVGNSYAYVSNSGLIEALRDTVYLSSDQANSRFHIVSNTGRIISTESGGIVMFLGDFGSSTITNSGEIISNFAAILSSASRETKDILNNTGLIESRAGTVAVSLGGGDDQIFNQGTIMGDVELGSGNDFYDGDGGKITGEISGWTGEDTITGGVLSDFIDGGDDNDRLFGRGGDDDLRGGLGSDFMSAGLGDDQVIGDDGADKMFGSAGDDTLQGGRDRDTIRGGDGEDEINGGRAQDVLRGGDGADVFLYQFRQDSTAKLADTIQDFAVGIDRIDLDALNVAFVGSAAFSGTAQEVRYEIGTDGRTFVQVDTDGNGSADMRINLTTVGALTEDDFIL